MSRTVSSIHTLNSRSCFNGQSPATVSPIPTAPIAMFLRVKQERLDDEGGKSMIIWFSFCGTGWKCTDINLLDK